MIRIYVSSVIDASADNVWQRIRDFNALPLWHPAIADRALPDSLYLPSKPAFFDAGRGYAWPWVDAAGPTKLHVLPAKARYDAGTPFTQP